MGGICQHGWANQPGYVYQEKDEFYRWDYGGLDHKKRVVLLHWAGIELGSAMPERTWYIKFRDGASSTLSYVGARMGDYIAAPFIKMLNAARSQQQLNKFYHYIFNRNL